MTWLKSKSFRYAGRGRGMGKIIVKAERAGQVLAQSELEVPASGRASKRVGRAFKLFRDEHPSAPLLDSDVRIKFEVIE